MENLQLMQMVIFLEDLRSLNTHAVLLLLLKEKLWAQSLKMLIFNHTEYHWVSVLESVLSISQL